MECEEAIVVESSGGTVRVRRAQINTCASCSRQRGCSDPSTSELDVLDFLGAKPGDKVAIAFAKNAKTWAACLLFIVPVIMLLGGYMAGALLISSKSEPAGIAGAFLGLLAWAGLVVAIKRIGFLPAYQKPRIVRILQKTKWENS